MLEKDITAKRKERHQKTQEDFTPVIVCILFNIYYLFIYLL